MRRPDHTPLAEVCVDVRRGGLTVQGEVVPYLVEVCVDELPAVALQLSAAEVLGEAGEAVGGHQVLRRTPSPRPPSGT